MQLAEIGKKSKIFVNFTGTGAESRSGGICVSESETRMMESENELKM
jgi:hypothetical protein